jgi:dihydrofolate synthase/folylpolyglutamate synthase
MAFLYFQDQKPDLAIVEAGLGGRLDSTNVIEPLLTAITNVSLEHTEHLGSTIEEIAFEKAGIIKPGAPLLAGYLSAPALKVIEAKLKETGSTGLFLGRDFRLLESGQNEAGPVYAYKGPKFQIEGLSLALEGPHQVDNAALSIALAESLSGLGYPVKPESVAKGLNDVNWPGRAERIPPGKWPPDGSGRAPLVLDGAHNPGGALAFSAYLEKARAKNANLNVHLIVGVMADKDVAGVLSPLLPKADRVYLTRTEYDRAATPEDLRERLMAANLDIKAPLDLYPSIPRALAAAAKAAGPLDLVAVSGSLFTVGETLAYLTGQPVVEPN